MNRVASIFKRAGSKANSLEKILEPHLDQLYRQAFHYCGNEQDAEDVLQDTLLEAHQREDQLRAAPVPGAWLNRTLYHRFVDRYRKHKHFKNDLDIDDHSLAAPNETSPSQNYYMLELLRAMDELSEPQRAVISFHDIEGKTLPEISELLGMPVGTLKSHLHRGRKILKNLLVPQPFSSALR